MRRTAGSRRARRGSRPTSAHRSRNGAINARIPAGGARRSRSCLSSGAICVVERLGHRDRDRDLLARGVRNLDLLEPRAALAAEQMQLGGGAAARGGRAPHECAAATRRADRRACDATAPSSADRADGRAGSTTPAAARSSTAPADASRQPGRSSAASCCRATRSSAPAQRDAPPHRPARSSSTTNRQPVVASSATSSS